MLLKGYEVWITCEGENLPEYGVAPEGDDGKTLACFIPSESGKVSSHALLPWTVIRNAFLVHRKSALRQFHTTATILNPTALSPYSLLPVDVRYSIQKWSA